jgi:ERF superfamily
MNATTTEERSAVLELAPVAEQLPAVQQQQAMTIASNSPAAMMLAAMDRGATLEQVEKMMDLQERFERREAEKAFFAALSGLRSEAIQVVKRKRVHFTSAKGTTDYKHAELSDVIEAAQPAMAKHGLSHRWDVKQDGRSITVTCIVSHAMGHSITVSLQANPDDTGNKNAIQQVTSTITYLQRHTLKAALGLSEKGDDDDGHGGKKPAGKQTAEPDDALQSLLNAGQEKAMEGMPAWAKWFNDLTPDQRTAITPHTKAMKDCARKSDSDKKGGAA